MHPLLVTIYHLPFFPTTLYTTPFFSDVDQVPTADLLHLMQQTGDPSMSSSYPLLTHSITLPIQTPSEKTPTYLYVSERMPLIPTKLAKHFQEGLFIKMVELMPDYIRDPNLSNEDYLKGSKFKNWEINNIVDWIQCFSLYIAIVC